MEQTDRTWNLSGLYKNDNDPKMASVRKAGVAATKAFESKWRGRSDYLSDPKILAEALGEYEAWESRYSLDGGEGFYFHLRSAQDQNDPKIKAKIQSITEFTNTNLNRIQFFELALAKIAPKDQTVMLAAPELAPYHHFLERLFASASHQLSEAEERIMNLKADTSYSRWVDMVEGFLSKEERQTLLEDGSRAKRNYESLITLVSSQNEAVRTEAVRHLNDIFLGSLDVGEIELNAILANKKVDDELRHFERPDSGRHLSDDIPTTVVDALVEAVSSQNHLPARFYKLKAQLMGKERLAYHERNVEYGQLNQSYPFEEGLALVGRVFGRLDPFFAKTLERFVKDGQIDVYPRLGKRGGAFCAIHLLSNPTYVLLNYTDSLKDVTTLAHEMGHAINDECMRGHVNALNFGTPMATAEVASQFMEDFVLDELAATADDEFRLAIMMSRLNDTVSSIFRQIGCYRFEQELHNQFRKQGYLAKEEIGRIFQKNMAAYMGAAVEQSPGAENWWIYWGHIRVFFYVYSYAGGLLIAKAMQDKVRKNPKFIEQVKTFFAGGTSKSPVDLFANMGIDISTPDFWRAGLKEVERLLDETEALAKKLGKI